MKEHYVSYEQAVKLKELGFGGNGLRDYIRQGYYIFPNGNISPIKHDGDGILVQFRKEDAERIPAPRLDQAQTWLRESKDAIVIAEPYWECEIEDDSDYLTGKWCFTVWKDGSRVLCNFDPNKDTEEIWLFDSYESALSAGIDKALELLTNKS